MQAQISERITDVAQAAVDRCLQAPDVASQFAQFEAMIERLGPGLGFDIEAVVLGMLSDAVRSAALFGWVAGNGPGEGVSSQQVAAPSG